MLILSGIFLPTFNLKGCFIADISTFFRRGGAYLLEAPLICEAVSFPCPEKSFVPKNKVLGSCPTPLRVTCVKLNLFGTEKKEQILAHKSFSKIFLSDAIQGRKTDFLFYLRRHRLTCKEVKSRRRFWKRFCNFASANQEGIGITSTRLVNRIYLRPTIGLKNAFKARWKHTKHCSSFVYILW